MSADCSVHLDYSGQTVLDLWYSENISRGFFLVRLHMEKLKLRSDLSPGPGRKQAPVMSTSGCMCFPPSLGFPSGWHIIERMAPYRKLSNCWTFTIPWHFYFWPFLFTFPPVISCRGRLLLLLPQGFCTVPSVILDFKGILQTHFVPSYTSVKLTCPQMKFFTISQEENEKQASEVLNARYTWIQTL